MKLFSRKLRPGLSIGAQKDFAANFNKMMAILENMEGVGGITITKRGDYFRFSLTGENDISSSGGGIPEGYEEETLNIITDAGILKRTVLVKTADKGTVYSPSENDERKVLQVTSQSNSEGYSYSIGVDYLHMAE